MRNMDSIAMPKDVKSMLFVGGAAALAAMPGTKEPNSAMPMMLRAQKDGSQHTRRPLCQRV